MLAPEYEYRWTEAVTPEGRTVPSLRASVRRSLSGWVSPTAQDGARGSQPPRSHDRGVPLSQKVAGWGTPRVTTNGGIGNPRRSSDRKARIEDQVAGWATPAARDWRSEAGPGHSERMAAPRGMPLSRQAAWTGGRGALAPAFSLWLIGFPARWLDSAPHAGDWRRWQVLMAPLSAGLRLFGCALSRVSETLSCRNSRRAS